LFLVALGLMSVPVAHELLHWKQNRRGATVASIAT
jgi:hypothetical protein